MQLGVERVLEMVADGTITTHIAARLPLAEAAKGLSLAGSGAINGKVVFTP